MEEDDITIIPTWSSWTYFRCFIGLHLYKLIREYDVKSNSMANPISGKCMTSRCDCCGKVNTKYIHLNDRL